MDIEKLKTFYHVVNTKSVGKAAKILSLNKSSISRQLASLEEKLGKKLIHWNNHIMTLSPHGEFLFEKSHKILIEIEAIKTSLHLDTNLKNKSITISTTLALASTWLTLFINEFLEANPDIYFQIKASNQAINFSLQEADVAIRPYCNDQENLVQTHLRSWRLHLYASDAYVKRFGEPKSFEDLDKHRLIILGDSPNLYPHNYTEWPLFRGTKHGKTRKPFLKINSLEGMFNLVKKGVGIGSFSYEFLKLQKTELRKILHDKVFYDVDAYYIYPKALQELKIIKSLEQFLLLKSKEQHYY